MPSHYDLLGVESATDTRRIRAAYIRLMKENHPDSLHSSGGVGEAKAKDLNLAFSVLKDPGRRALYDLSLRPAWRRPAGFHPDQMPLRTTASGETRRPLTYGDFPPPSRAHSLKLFLLRVAPTVAILVVALLTLPERTGPIRDDSAVLKLADQPGATIDGVPRPVQIDRANVVDAAQDMNWIASEGDLGDAVSYSRHCFEEFALSPNYSLLDRCVAFDLAASLWAEKDIDGEALSSRLFFMMPHREERHLAYATMLSPDAAIARTRLADIERITTSVLAGSMTSR